NTCLPHSSISIEKTNGARPVREPCVLCIQQRNIPMQYLTRWIIGGLVAMVLWVPGVGAQDLQHDRRAIRLDHRALRHDRWHIRHDRHAGRYDALRRDRLALRHDRADRWADRRALRRDWRSFRQARFGRW